MANYVDNKEMLDALVVYLEECNQAEKEGKEIPRIPEYLGLCFIKIADNFGKQASFASYTFLDEMKSDGVISCVKYIRNFNPERTNNPFAYFTQFIKNAFLQRIDSEKANLYGRYKSYQDLQLMEQINGDEGACGPELNDISNSFISNYEERQEMKKQRAREKAKEKKPSITALYDDD